MRRLYYPAVIGALAPLNWLLSRLLARRVTRGSVLHVSYMGHIPFQTVEILRQHGINARYFAVGESRVWSRADYQLPSTGSGWLRPFIEFWLVWTIVARFAIVHLHFMVTPTRTGWELPLLKRMGRKVVVHYRGCEIRDRDLNMRLHPAINICQQCDYRPYICRMPHNVARRRLAAVFGDAFLVTTPDLKDFAPEATHLPFFAPATPLLSPAPGRRPFTIVHATNHPGIEGTEEIRRVIDRLRQRGHDVRFEYLHGDTQQAYFEALANADLAIGKMKMGYYANAQIESMAMGVPTVTCVRPEFMTPELAASAFIFSSLDGLEQTLEHYLTHPDELQRKRELARQSILSLHDNRVLAGRYQRIYEHVESLD